MTVTCTTTSDSRTCVVMLLFTELSITPLLNIKGSEVDILASVQYIKISLLSHIKAISKKVTSTHTILFTVSRAFPDVNSHAHAHNIYVGGAVLRVRGWSRKCIVTPRALAPHIRNRTNKHKSRYNW